MMLKMADVMIAAGVASPDRHPDVLEMRRDTDRYHKAVRWSEKQHRDTLVQVVRSQSRLLSDKRPTDILPHWIDNEAAVVVASCFLSHCDRDTMKLATSVAVCKRALGRVRGMIEKGYERWKPYAEDEAKARPGTGTVGTAVQRDVDGDDRGKGVRLD